MVEYYISSTDIPGGIRHVRKGYHKDMKALLLPDNPMDNAKATEIQKPTNTQKNDVLTFDTTKHHKSKARATRIVRKHHIPFLNNVRKSLHA
jgi:hypothetical protein